MVDESEQVQQYNDIKTTLFYLQMVIIPTGILNTCVLGSLIHVIATHLVSPRTPLGFHRIPLSSESASRLANSASLLTYLLTFTYSSFAQLSGKYTHTTQAQTQTQTQAGTRLQLTFSQSRRQLTSAVYWSNPIRSDRRVRFLSSVPFCIAFTCPTT